MIEPPAELMASLTLDPYAAGWPKFVMVIDADALLSSISHQCQKGWVPRLLRLLRSSECRGFAPDHVYGEVYGRLHRFASEAVPTEVLRDCFETEYLPHLRWVQTSTTDINDPRVELVRAEDETDVPTAQLASLLAPCLVVSGDKHLRRPGVASTEWRTALGHGAEVVDAAAQQQGLVMAVGLPSVAIVGGGIKLGERVRLPWWGSVSVLGAVGFAVLRDPRRRKSIARHVRPIVEAFAEVLADAYRRERDGTVGLKTHMFQPTDPPTLKQQVATVLARAREPMLAAEVRDELGRHFESVPSLDAIRTLLRANSEFTRPERYRWALGRTSVPWTGDL